MEYQSPLIKKPVLEIGDPVTCIFPVPDLGTIVATIKATIIGIESDVYRIKISHGSYGNPIETEVDVTADRLTQLTAIPNPQWLAYTLETADKISYRDWSGEYLYDEWSEQYFESLEDFTEWHEDHETDKEDIPDYCFGTRPKTFKILSAEDQCEYWYEEEEDMELSDFQGLKYLEEAIDAFNELNPRKVYYPDYSIVITFGGETT
jgi:hypothetical protein